MYDSKEVVKEDGNLAIRKSVLIKVLYLPPEPVWHRVELETMCVRRGIGIHHAPAVGCVLLYPRNLLLRRLLPSNGHIQAISGSVHKRVIEEGGLHLEWVLEIELKVLLHKAKALAL